jgi:hypothetical protein
MPRNPSLRHVYASVAELNDTLVTGGASALTSAPNNARKLEILDEVSRLIDAKSRRGSGFGPWVGTQSYDGDGSAVLWLRADLASLTSLTVYTSPGDTAPVTPVVETDFYLAGLSSYEAPFRKIIFNGQGTTTAFGSGYRTTVVVGTWSYPYRTRVLTPTTSEALDDSETEIDVSALTGLSAGMTILIDTEQMYVTATTDAVTDSITVERGVNGTTAAAHDTAKAITRYVYDASVHTLALRLAEKRWKAKDAGADGSDGGPDVGTVSLREGEDTIIRRMLGAPIMLTGYV